MLIRTSKGMRDDNISLNTFYVIVVIVIAFTAGIALFVLYNIISPASFDYRVFAQEEDNETAADNTTSIANLSSNTTLIDFVSNLDQIRAHLNAAIF